MARGVNRPKILSPAEAEAQLRGPCALILAGVAQPVFSVGFRGAPSPVVFVVGVRPPGPNMPQVPLPVSVEGGQWQAAVVPVLQDDRWSLSHPLARSLVGGGWDEFVRLVGAALRVSFVNAGYGPS